MVSEDAGGSGGERELRRTMRDLVALSTLPALWTGLETEAIAESLCEALLKILGADFVVVAVRQDERAPISICRGAPADGGTGGAGEVLERLRPWLADGSGEPPEQRHPGDGALLRSAVARFGHSGDYGVVVALSRRDTFPSEAERLLLGVGGNQAATVLQRKRTEEALREAARRKDEFLAMLGHELRNPLAPLRNCLDILDHGDDPAGRRRARATMRRQVGHLTRLVDDLLDVSRISRGKLQLRKERLDGVAVVRETVEDHRPAVAAAGLRLELDLPPEPLWLEGDRVRLAQALGNLLENACKFTDRGGSVKVTLRRDGGAAAVRVADDGIGIAAEDLPHVLEAFSQSSAPGAQRGGGLGLGLAVVRSVADLHGGTVSVSSDGPACGTEVELRLPLLPDDTAPSVEVLDAAPTGATGDRRILLIEDNLDSAETLSELLRLRGHRVETAHDGEQGISKARDFRPDVVLCDIGLPGGMDGYDVARAMRRDPEVGTAFLVALTGFGRDTDRQKATEAGFDAHLTKPADPSALQRLIAERRAAGPDGEDRHPRAGERTEEEENSVVEPG